MASTMVRGADDPHGAPHEASLTYRFAAGLGRRLAVGVEHLFAWADRCLEGSSLYRAARGAASRIGGIVSGSLLVRWLWPYARMAVVPYGEKMTVETALGIVLALTCVAPTEIVMVASAGVLALMLWERCRASRTGDSRVRLWHFPGFGIMASVGVVLVFVVGATVTSAEPSLSVFNMVLWFFYFAMFLMAGDASHRGRSVHLIWPFLTGAAFAGLLGLYQRLTGGVIMPSHWIDQAFEGDLVRVTGPFTNPIFFGEMMALALPLSLTMFLLRTDWRDRLALMGFAGLQALGLLLSSTRGAWLGFAVSFCVLAVLYNWKMLPLGIACGALGFAAAPPVLVKRLMSAFSLADSSNAYRISIWRGSLAIVRDHLFRGIGLGAEVFRKVYPEYQIIQTPTPHAHSTFLEFLIEVGALGFLAMVCLFWLWLRDAFDAILAPERSTKVRWEKVGVLAGSVAAVSGHLLHGVIDYTWYSPRIAAVFWAIMGMGAGITSLRLIRSRPFSCGMGAALSEGDGSRGEGEPS